MATSFSVIVLLLLLLLRPSWYWLEHHDMHGMRKRKMVFVPHCYSTVHIQSRIYFISFFSSSSSSSCSLSLWSVCVARTTQHIVAHNVLVHISCVRLILIFCTHSCVLVSGTEAKMCAECRTIRCVHEHNTDTCSVWFMPTRWRAYVQRIHDWYWTGRIAL